MYSSLLTSPSTQRKVMGGENTFRLREHETGRNGSATISVSTAIIAACRSWKGGTPLSQTDRFRMQRCRTQTRRTASHTAPDHQRSAFPRVTFTHTQIHSSPEHDYRYRYIKSNPYRWQRWGRLYCFHRLCWLGPLWCPCELALPPSSPPGWRKGPSPSTPCPGTPGALPAEPWCYSTRSFSSRAPRPPHWEATTGPIIRQTVKEPHQLLHESTGQKDWMKQKSRCNRLNWDNKTFPVYKTLTRSTTVLLMMGKYFGTLLVDFLGWINWYRFDHTVSVRKELCSK